MGENVNPPPVPGFTAQQYATAIEKASNAESKLADLTSRFEAIETEAQTKAQEAASTAAQAKLTELESANATATEAAKKGQEMAIKAYRSQHLGGLKSPEYAALAPTPELEEDGSGLTEESVKALKKWKEKHSELFTASKVGGTTPAPGGRPGEGISADMLLNLRVAGVDPAKAQELANSSPLGALIGWGADNG